MLENEKKLVQEITELKADGDKQTKDQYRTLEQERENYKAKMYDIENKAKVAGGRSAAKEEPFIYLYYI